MRFLPKGLYMSLSSSTGSPIAYVTAYYPAVSHTFILREIAALRDLGLHVQTAAIREPDPAQIKGQAERDERARTFYILQTAKRIWPLLHGAAMALSKPKRLMQAIALAWRIRPAGLKALVYQAIYLAEAMVLARWLQQTGAGHLHCHFANASATVAMLAARLAACPFSFTLHGPSDLFEAKHWHLGTKVENAQFVACISHFARSQAMLHSPADTWDRLNIIHCGVEPERYQKTAQITTDKDGLHLVFVGRMAPVKGLRILMEALTLLPPDQPKPRLTLVGDGEDRQTLEALAQDVAADVVFTGYLDQPSVADVLSTADAFVLPSFAEGVPVVLMEAMAAQLPVIATQVAGVAELIDNGKNGFLVAPGDASGLAQAISDLGAMSPDARDALGINGREKVQESFDIRKEAKRLADLFTRPSS